MEVYIFKLKFKSTHFGETGIDLDNVSEWVNSDTLFSALVNAHKEVYGIKETTEFIEKKKKNSPFIFSSLFAYSEDRFFLPKPLVDSQINKELKKQTGKDLKKIKWLDLKYFQKWLRGDISEEDVKEMKSLQTEYRKTYVVDIRPRVTLDRLTSKSNIYHSGFVHFKENAGLYGLVIFSDENFKSRFKNILEILGEMGLGGERTYGCGMFKVERFEKANDYFKEVFFEKLDIHVVLSLYHPAEKEFSNLKDNAIAYDIVRKRGWITTGREALPYKRKSVGFFTEGSVFKVKPKGMLVDVTPDGLDNALPHKVYRYGYAFSIPLNGDNQ